MSKVPALRKTLRRVSSKSFIPPVQKLQNYFIDDLAESIDGDIHEALLTELIRKYVVTKRELRQAKERLELLSITDGLTGLYNHRHFHDLMDGQINHCLRRRATFSLILFDIDHFKKFNDTHGHQAGDKVLGAVSDTVKHNTRKEDFCCRYGGEEFAVILPDTDMKEAFITAEHIRKSIQSLSVNLGEGVNEGVTVSLGVVEFTDGRKVPEMVRLADEALYQSKADGRNRTTRADN